MTNIIPPRKRQQKDEEERFYVTNGAEPWQLVSTTQCLNGAAA